MRKNIKLLLQESYYGKPEECKELEKYFEILRNDIYRNDLSDIDTPLIEIENILAKLINVEKISVFIYLQELENIYISREFAVEFFGIPKYSNELIKSKNGIRFKNPKGKVYRILITKKILENKKFKTDYLIASLFHEMGHAIYFTKSFEILKNTNSFYKFLDTSYNFFSKSIDKIKSFFNIKTKSVEKKNNDIENKKLYLPNDYLYYMGEKFADNFATSFGYGVELIKGLNVLRGKNRKEKIFVNQNIIMRIITDINKLFSMTVKSNYPEHIARINSQINKLKFELKNKENDLTPEIVLEIKNQINEMEKILKKILVIKFDNEEMKKEFNKSVNDFINNHPIGFLNIIDRKKETKDYTWNNIL